MQQKNSMNQITVSLPPSKSRADRPKPATLFLLYGSWAESRLLPYEV